MASQAEQIEALLKKLQNRNSRKSSANSSKSKIRSPAAKLQQAHKSQADTSVQSPSRREPPVPQPNGSSSVPLTLPAHGPPTTEISPGGLETPRPAKPSEPAAQQYQPAQQSQPAAQPSEPAQSSGPITKPANLAEPTNKPARPAEPIIRPVEPATKPAEPVTKPAEPTTRPAEPITRPAEPATKPAEPVTKPAEPTTRPAEPTTRPTETAAVFKAASPVDRKSQNENSLPQPQPEPERYHFAVKKPESITNTYADISTEPAHNQAFAAGHSNGPSQQAAAAAAFEQSFKNYIASLGHANSRDLTEMLTDFHTYMDSLRDYFLMLNQSEASTGKAQSSHGARSTEMTSQVVNPPAEALTQQPSSTAIRGSPQRELPNRKSPKRVSESEPEPRRAEKIRAVQAIAPAPNPAPNPAPYPAPNLAPNPAPAAPSDFTRTNKYGLAIRPPAKAAAAAIPPSPGLEQTVESEVKTRISNAPKSLGMVRPELVSQSTTAKPSGSNSVQLGPSTMSPLAHATPVRRPPVHPIQPAPPQKTPAQPEAAPQIQIKPKRPSKYDVIIPKRPSKYAVAPPTPEGTSTGKPRSSLFLQTLQNSNPNDPLPPPPASLMQRSGSNVVPIAPKEPPIVQSQKSMALGNHSGPRQTTGGSLPSKRRPVPTMDGLWKQKWETFSEQRDNNFA